MSALVQEISAPGQAPALQREFDAYNSEASYASYVRNAGNLNEADLMIAGIHCAGCIRTIEHGLQRAGAAVAEVNFGTHRARVLWDDDRIRLGGLLDALHKLGYTARPYDPAVQERAHISARRWAVTRLGVAGFGAANSMLYSVGLYAGYFYGIAPAWQRLFQGITAWIALPVALFSGWPFLSGAWQGLRGHRVNMDGLISLGLLSALGYSWVAYLALPGRETYFESVTMGVFVLLIGRTLETVMRARMGGVTESLVSRQARWGTRLESRNGKTVESIVPIEALCPGDHLLVRVGEIFPVDGVLREGETEADESALTGESAPKAIAPGGTVLGGTVNTGLPAVIEATSAGTESLLGRIARLVDLAQHGKAPVQRIADAVAGYFALAVIALAAISFAYWTWVAASLPPQPVWAIAITVIIIACPCGLGLATPMAVLAANALAASQGILVKGGAALERAARLTDIVLDKTGTLTEGTLRVNQIVDTGGLPRGRWLSLAAAVEGRVIHPIATALCKAWSDEHGIERLAVEGVQVYPGRGAAGTADGQKVLVGNERMMSERGIPIPEMPMDARISASETRAYVAVENRIEGVLTLSDPPRSDAATALAALQKSGLRIRLFSGDSQAVVTSVASRLGIDDARGGMLPEDKLAAIAALQKEGCVVAMVGDGINDGPALTRADVGFALGTGSALALEAASILLLRPRLAGILETVNLARRSYRVIRQNLTLSAIYNLCAIPVAMAGWVIPLVAAVSMALSSLIVVLNSLRLRLWGGSGIFGRLRAPAVATLRG